MASSASEPVQLQPTRRRISEREITTVTEIRSKMRAMSESSLPPFGPARKPRALGAMNPAVLLRRLRARLGGLRKRRGKTGNVGAGQHPELESRARGLIREYLEAQAANLERAQRLVMKATRLEEAGTPSESASNRAERARREVYSGLAALRERFIKASRQTVESAQAFDRMVEAVCPAFVTGRPSQGHPQV